MEKVFQILNQVLKKAYPNQLKKGAYHFGAKAACLSRADLVRMLKKQRKNINGTITWKPHGHPGFLVEGTNDPQFGPFFTDVGIVGSLGFPQG
jgi:hypothetical protein